MTWSSEPQQARTGGRQPFTFAASARYERWRVFDARIGLEFELEINGGARRSALRAPWIFGAVQVVDRGVDPAARVRDRGRRLAQELELQAVDRVGRVKQAVVVRVSGIKTGRSRFTLEQESKKEDRVADVQHPAPVHVAAAEASG